MPKQDSGQEICLEGQPVARGLAIGIPCVLNQFESKIPEIHLSHEEVGAEIERYRKALKESRDDILRLKGELAREGVQDGVLVLETHLEIIEDPLLNRQIEEEVRQAKKNVEFIFQRAIERFRKKFEAISDPFFQSRFEDVQDISKRVLAYLRDMKRTTLGEVPQNSIVFTRQLSPTDAAEAKRTHVLAFVTQIGGATSHTAIVARAKGIPYVANVNFSKLQEMNKASLTIVDGLLGKVIINPTEETLDYYRCQKLQLAEQQETLKSTSFTKALTLDGQNVRLSANVEIADDFSLLQQYGAEGVGLFRSEYIVLQKGSFPSEEEQFEIYKSLVEHANGHPVVIRAFDIGMDKVACALKSNLELNPALGCRAIRFLLHEKELFKAQMRAILRASAYGDVRILFPMISSLNELMEAKIVVSQAYEELAKEECGLEIKQNIKLGCMIEVPSAALIVDLLAKECDFLSIGTNDLIQYATAIDRSSQTMSALYTSTHPGVLRLMKMIVELAQKQNVPVSVCGEIASDPRFVPLLLGLGITELSVSCRFLPIIKHVIRHTQKQKAVDLVTRLLELATAHEIQDALVSEYESNVPAGSIKNF